MFTRIQARAFRCLKSINQDLRSFHALVGPNASGKTTFLDVIAFLSELLLNRGEVIPTVLHRSADFHKLLWLEKGDAFQIAVEAEIPPSVRNALSEEYQEFTLVRYELEVGIDFSSKRGLSMCEPLWAIFAISGPWRGRRIDTAI